METEKRVELLDHGYIKVIETWGSDQRVIEAARMSTDGGFEGWGPVCKSCGARQSMQYDGPEPVCAHCLEVCPGEREGDEKLPRYLYENRHATPFEMAGLIVEVQAPIFVFREWHRHRTQSYNEMSARYTPLPDLYYVPTVERLLVNASGSNRQANRVQDAPELTSEKAREFTDDLRQAYTVCETLYQTALAEGVPKELARAVMPVGHYSRMRASANLRNWLGFMTLRSAPNAQWEIRQYSHALERFIGEAFPRTAELWRRERARS